jgi:hypothetical protein
MSDSHDFDFVSSHPVDQAERIQREDVAAGATPMPRPHARILRDRVDGVPQFLTKGMGCGKVSGGVPVIGRLRLLRGSGVEPDGRWGHSAPVESGPNLFPGDGFDGAGIQFGHPALDLDAPRVLDTLVGFSVQRFDEQPQQRSALARLKPHRFVKELSR